jgi:hypothetical protein
MTLFLFGIAVGLFLAHAATTLARLISSDEQ